MHQAIDSGWYSTEDGGEVFINKGTVRPDNHPDVKAVPTLFEELPNEPAQASKSVPAKVKETVAKAVAPKASPAPAVPAKKGGKS